MPSDTEEPKEKDGQKETPNTPGMLDSIVGRSDWKKSKFGYLTGITPIFNVIGGQLKLAAHSIGRISRTYKILMSEPEVETLPDVDTAEYDGNVRFREAMKLHRMDEGKLTAAVSNTRRSAYLYAVILIVSIVYFGIRVVTAESMSITTLGLHLSPVPIFTVLLLRALYYNWMFRKRTLQPLGKFITSKDWLPR